ncbi:MAG: eCIS core domain-containing protein [Acidimicrobiia bacterium]
MVRSGRVRIVIVPWLMPNVRAITFGRWVVVRAGNERDEQLLAHELVHVMQWERLGWWRFLRVYLGAYWLGRRNGLAHWDAYAAIPLEVQARALADEVRPLSSER